MKDKKLNSDINVLVTSVSSKISILKALRNVNLRLANAGNIWGGDVNGACIGRYFVDKFWEMPQLDSMTIDSFIGFCHSKKITCIIPTRDGELSFFSKHRETLSSENIRVMVSNYDAIQTCLDKLIFFNQCRKFGFPVIMTVPREKLDVLDCSSYVVKERFGAGARKIALDVSRNQAISHADRLDVPVFQPYLLGREYSVDLYVDLAGRTKGAIARVREVVVNGESQVTVTVRNEKLEQMCGALAQRLGLYGHVLFQVLIDEAGEFHIIECNARFGGASALALEVGLDSFFWFLFESLGKDISFSPFTRSHKEKKLIRYPRDLII